MGPGGEGWGSAFPFGLSFYTLYYTHVKSIHKNMLGGQCQGLVFRLFLASLRLGGAISDLRAPRCTPWQPPLGLSCVYFRVSDCSTWGANRYSTRGKKNHTTEAGTHAPVQYRY